MLVSRIGGCYCCLRRAFYAWRWAIAHVAARSQSVPVAIEGRHEASYPSRPGAYRCHCPRGCCYAGDEDCRFCEHCYHDGAWCKCDCMGCRARGRGAESNPTLRQAGEAEAATLTEGEAAPGEAAAPGSASCLAGAALVLEDRGPYICIYCSNVPAECTCDTGDGDPGSASTAPRLRGPRSSRDLILPGDGDGGRNRPVCPRCGAVISELFPHDSEEVRCEVCADWFDGEARRRQRLADAKDGGVAPKAPPRLFRGQEASATPSAQPTRPVRTPRTRRDEPSSSTGPQGSWV